MKKLCYLLSIVLGAALALCAVYLSVVLPSYKLENLIGEEYPKVNVTTASYRSLSLYNDPAGRKIENYTARENLQNYFKSLELHKRLGLFITYDDLYNNDTYVMGYVAPDGTNLKSDFVINYKEGYVFLKDGSIYKIKNYNQADFEQAMGDYFGNDLQISYESSAAFSDLVKYSFTAENGMVLWALNSTDKYVLNKSQGENLAKYFDNRTLSRADGKPSTDENFLYTFGTADDELIAFYFNDSDGLVKLTDGSVYQLSGYDKNEFRKAMWNIGAEPSAVIFADAIGENYPKDKSAVYKDESGASDANLLLSDENKKAIDYLSDKALLLIGNDVDMGVYTADYTFGYASDNENKIDPKFSIDSRKGILRTVDGKYYLVQDYDNGEFVKIIDNTQI